MCKFVEVFDINFFLRVVYIAINYALKIFYRPSSLIANSISLN